MINHKAFAWLLALALADLTQAADWPQFRGPNRDGIAPDSPALADSWPKEGPKLVWKSDPLPTVSSPGKRSGGCGSVAVAGGRAYVYHAWKHDTTFATRTLTTAAHIRLGWIAGLSDDLATRIETHRLSEKRASLKGAELNDYVKQLIASNLGSTPPDPAAPAPGALDKKFAKYASDRILAGPNAIAWKDLVKLATVKDKEFPTAEEFDKALAALELTDAVKQQTVSQVPTSNSSFTDTFVCLNADTGKEIWKKECPGFALDYAASGTPTVARDRVYVAGSNAKVYCLNAADGAVVWEAPTKARFDARVSSSFLVLDQAAILMGGELTAYDRDTGKQLWSQPKIKATENSAVLWSQAGKNYLICNGQTDVFCVDPQDGRILWQAPGGLYSTATVSGDFMAVYSSKGLFTYKMTPEKVEALWQKKVWTDRGAGVVFDKGYMYVVGGRIACVEVETGNVKWEARAGGEICSPVLVDGKIISGEDNGANTICFRATPEKFEQLGKAKLNQAICTSPAVADGRLYLRLDQAVACYELKR